MPMTSTQILAAIAASPTLQAEAAARNDAAIAAALSAGRTVQGSIPVGTLLGWTAATGMQAIIYDTAYTPGSAYYATPLRSAALSMLAAQASSTPLDMSASQTGQGNLALLNAWVTAGALTQADLNALIALATQPDPVSVGSVSDALNGN